MIKYIISIILILCMALTVIAFYDDVDYNEKVTTPKLNLNLDIKENNGTYNMIIDGIEYNSKIEIDSKGYNINNLSINNTKSDRNIVLKDIINEIDSFSFSFNDKIYETIKNKNTSINIRIQIDGSTITKPEMKKSD